MSALSVAGFIFQFYDLTESGDRLYSLYWFSDHRRRVHPALVSVVIRRTRCAGDAGVARTTFRSHNAPNVDTQKRKCVHVSYYFILSKWV